MKQGVDTRRIAIFILIAFAIAWATGLYIYLNGGLSGGPEVAPGFPLAVLLLAGPYMFAPGIANVLTRLLTGEGRRALLLWPHFRSGWRYYLAAWFIPGLLTLAGAVLFFILFPEYFDPNLSILTRQLAQTGAAFQPWPFVLMMTTIALLLSPLLNGIATFGEEFGWRAYLLPKLMPLGGRRAVVVSGIIWGIWHWPVIVMGYEYGFGYAFFPFTGMLLFLVFTMAIGALLAWVTLKSASVWPAVVGHAAVNGIAAISVYFIQGQPNSLLGPVPVGIVGGLGYILFALWLFARRDSFPQLETDSTPHNAALATEKRPNRIVTS